MNQEIKDTFKEIGELFLKMADQLDRYDEGWVVWKGGENPAPNKRVCVQFRDGDIYTAIQDDNEYFLWDHKYGERDIIAYKVVKDSK
jgi:hypothetical protein